MFKLNNNRRKSCEICSKLTTETLERRDCCRSGVIIVNVEQIPNIVQVFDHFVGLTLKGLTTTFCSIAYSVY